MKNLIKVSLLLIFVGLFSCTDEEISPPTVNFLKWKEFGTGESWNYNYSRSSISCAGFRSSKEILSDFYLPSGNHQITIEYDNKTNNKTVVYFHGYSDNNYRFGLGGFEILEGGVNTKVINVYNPIKSRLSLVSFTNPQLDLNIEILSIKIL